MKHLFIINPIAGGKKNRYEDTVQKIEAFANNLSDPFEIYVTKEPMDAVSKIKHEAAGADMLRVYSCGGDGTLNECANGAAYLKHVAITHYPCGTGNDFIKTFGRENIDKFRDLDLLTTGEIHEFDLIDCEGRYGINICSVGFDARIGGDVHKYSHIPVIGGATGYVVSLLVNTIKGVTQKFNVSCGDYSKEDMLTLLCACNGRFYGGGFNPVPDAMPDDGLIDFLIVKGVSRLGVAKVVGKYSKGFYREFPELITHIREKYMEIHAEKPFVVNIDGEIIHTKNISFKILPKAVNFILPKGVSCV